MKLLKPQYIDVPQGSDEWHSLRALRLTASHAQAIGTNGKGLDSYIERKLSKYNNEGVYVDHDSYDMQRGRLHESDGIKEYLKLNSEAFYPVRTNLHRPGFVINHRHIGCSPDAVLSSQASGSVKWGIEMKCPNINKYIELLEKQKPDSKHVWQCEMCMLVTGLNHWDLCYYNKYYEGDEDNIIVFRLTRNQERVDKLLAGLERGVRMIEEAIS